MSDQEDALKEGIVDMIQLVFERSKEELLKVECPEHGKALKTLDFDRDSGRFKIDTCCEQGEALVQKAIENL